MAIFSPVYADEDFKYTFPYNALIMCLCHEIAVKHPHYEAVTHQTQGNYDEKKAENKTQI